MFDQPPLTAKEVFTRGFVDGLAVLFGAFLFSLLSMLPSRHRFYLQHNASPWTSFPVVWPILGTIGCVVLFFRTNDELKSVYRAGVSAAFAILAVSTAALWLTIH